MINMPRVLRKQWVTCMNTCSYMNTCNVHRDMEALRRNKKLMLEIKNNRTNEKCL